MRELEEEAGVKVAIADLQFAHAMHRRSQDEGGRDYMDIAFVAERWEGEPYAAEPDKGDDARWAPLTELPDNTVPYIKKMIEALLQKTPYSEELYAVP